MIKKSFYILTAVVAMLFASCEKYDHAISDIEDRLDKIEGTSLTTIDQQIAAINGSIDDLKKVDAELDGYIKSLQTTAADLQSQLDATNEKIDNVKKEMGDEIDAVEQNLLNELNKLKTYIEGELATINNAIAALQAKDAELDQKIADLRTYVDNELANYATKDWANATFSTLTQYLEIQNAIADIESDIKKINEALKDLETRINEKIAADIKAAIDALRTELGDAYKAAIETAVDEVTNAYKTAIETAKEEIEEAYTAAIEAEINALEIKMRGWVNEQLQQPLKDIADLQAALNALTGEVATDEELAAAVAAQQTALEQAKKDLTDAYEKAIVDAVANGGIISDAIAAAVKTAQDALQGKINEITVRIDNIEKRLEDLATRFANRIQSLTFIPQYSDGKVEMDYASRMTMLDFIVSPAELAQTIKTAFNEDFNTIKVFVRYTKDPTTRATSEEPVQQIVNSIDVIGSDGMFTLSIHEQGLSVDFWQGRVEAVIYIQITDGYGNNVVSEAIPMIAHNYAGNTNTIGGYGDGGSQFGEAGQ